MRFNLGYGTFGFWLESSNSPRFDDPDTTRAHRTEIRQAFSDDDITATVDLARTAGYRHHLRIAAYNLSGTTYSEARWFVNPVGLACARPKLCSGTPVFGQPVSGVECCYDDLDDTLRLADVARSADLGNPHNLGTARIGGFPAIVTYDAQAYAATGDARLATPASPAGNFGADFVQQQAVSVQKAATFWYDWLLTRWAINSFEDSPVGGLGAPIRAYVNLTTDRNGNPVTDNADADGLSRTIGFFVPGPRARVTAGMPEGVWHELFHLLINNLTRGALATGWEAAAIQEALADFGACVAKVYDGFHTNVAFSMRMLRTDGSFSALRHLRNPKSTYQLDGRIYPTRYVNDPDWCPESQAEACDFEYTNSLPLSHALVNLAIGGPHPDTGLRLPAVGSLGVEATFGVVLRAIQELSNRRNPAPVTMPEMADRIIVAAGGLGTAGGDLAREVFAAHGFLGGGPIGTPPPQPTPTPPPCRSGDCDGSGSVEIDDLIKATNVALGLQPVTACSAADADGNGQVQVDEILAAVGLSLSGCGGGGSSGSRLAAADDSLPSPTPTRAIAEPVSVQLQPGNVDARSGVPVSIPLYVWDSVAGNHVQGLLFDLALPSVLDPAFCFLEPALDAAFTLQVATPMPGITRLLVLPRTYPTADVIPDGLFARCATRTKANSLIDTYPIVVSNVSVATLGTPEDMIFTREGKLRITTGTGSNLTLSGRVTYFRSPTSEPVPVAGVSATLWPRNQFSIKAVTDTTGTFSFTGLERVDQHLTVRRKDAGAAAAAGFADAAWVLDAVTGNRLLGPEETLAADVTGDGTVSHIDALRILENAVARATAGPQTPFAVSERCNADFILLPRPSAQPNQSVNEPAVSPQWCSRGNISYAPLGGSAGNQDFVAVAAGDVTGDWPVATGMIEPPPPAPGEDWVPTEAAVDTRAAERLSRIDSAIVRLRDASAEEIPFTSLTRRQASRVKSAQKRLAHALAVATKLLVREHDRLTGLQGAAHPRRAEHVAAENPSPSTGGRKRS